MDGLIAQFVGVTGAGEAQAVQFLQATGNNVDEAVMLYFSSGGDEAPAAAPQAAPEAGPAGGDDDEQAAFLESLKKKKKKKRADEPAEQQAEGENMYNYSELLTRLYEQMRLLNPSMAGEKKKYTLKPPNVVRDGTKKSAFTNFQDICKSMNRQIDHLLLFILTELGTSGSIDANNCLILRGRFTPKQVEGLLRKYIAEYVQCAMCHSLDTKLHRDAASRLHQLQCGACGASRTVNSIQSGYHAQIGRRKK